MPDESTTPADDAGDMSVIDAIYAQSEMQLGALLLAAEDGLQVPAKSVLYELTADGIRISATGADDASYDNEFLAEDIDAILAEDEPVEEAKDAKPDAAAEKPAEQAAA